MEAELVAEVAATADGDESARLATVEQQKAAVEEQKAVVEMQNKVLMEQARHHLPRSARMICLDRCSIFRRWRRCRR